MIGPPYLPAFFSMAFASTQSSSISSSETFFHSSPFPAISSSICLNLDINLLMVLRKASSGLTSINLPIFTSANNRSPSSHEIARRVEEVLNVQRERDDHTARQQALSTCSQSN